MSATGTTFGATFRALLAGSLLVAAFGCRRGTAEPAPPAPAPAQHASAPFPSVHFEALRPLLPTEIDGFTRDRDEGSTGRYGEVAISEAERSFVEGDRELVFRIVDTSMARKLGGTIREVVQFAETHRDAENGPIALPGRVGFLRYDPERDRAEANLLVADRYVVAVTGEGFGDTREVEQLVARIDLDALAQLR